jgi:mandelamide amidase
MHTSRRRVLMAAACMVPLYAAGACTLLQAGGGRRRELAGPVDDLADLSARDAVRHILEGSLKAEDYATRLLEQYDRFRYLNTVISIDRAQVLEHARTIDVARSRGEQPGPLAGLPFMVKDQIEAIGYPTTAGTAALRNYMPRKNALVVDAMLRSGAVLFAKANLQELAAGPTSSNPTFGFVRNPYDPTRIPGGSSGGNAAALAARIVPAGLGEDTGGSIRIPVAMCGVAGLRPSTGGLRKRYPDAGLVPPARPDDLQTIGPMARTVDDVALLDTVITSEPVVPMSSLRGVRLGIPPASYWERDDVDRSTATLMQDVYGRLRDRGTQTVEVDFETLIGLGDKMQPALMSRDRDAAFSAWLAENLPGVTLEDVIAGITSKDVKASRLSRRPDASTEVMSDQAKTELRASVASEYENLFRSWDIAAVAFPCVPVPAPVIKTGGDEPGDQIEVNGKWLGRNAVLIRNTWWGARMGAPGLVIPAGLVRGLPIGMEIEALPGDDSRLLGLGIAIENALGPLPAPSLIATKGA